MRSQEKHVCGVCEYNRPTLKNGKLCGFHCGNEESDYYGCGTAYDDKCEEWEEKEPWES